MPNDFLRSVKSHLRQKQKLYVLCLVTVSIFPLTGEFINRAFLNSSLLVVFQQGISWYWQILIGLAYGAISAYIARKIVETPAMEDVKTFFAKVVRNMEVNIFDVLLISFCAGFGEELLFRGSVQPMLGIWITAVIFVALHGYLNPWNWSLTLYGLYMVFLSAGLGYLYEHVGIVSAITAHFLIDVILLMVLLTQNDWEDWENVEEPQISEQENDPLM